MGAMVGAVPPASTLGIEVPVAMAEHVHKAFTQAVPLQAVAPQTMRTATPAGWAAVMAVVVQV